MDSYKTLYSELRQLFKTHANEAHALAQQKYMKSSMPFWGISKPELKLLAKRIILQHKPINNDEYRKTVSFIFNAATHREEWYAALLYARSHKKYISTANIDIYLAIILKAQWWDIVDETADHLVGKALLECSDKRSILLELIKHENMWVRRTAIIAQLKYKNSTDSELLAVLIKETAHEKEFFIKKAIGWALREYSKTNQIWTQNFINENKHLLQPLSIRESSKYLS